MRSSNSGSDNADSDDSVELLFDGSDMTSDEALLGVMKNFVKQRSSKTNLDQTVRLIKRMLPQPNDMPRNGKAAMTRLEKITGSFKMDEFTFCKKCLQLVDAANECLKCESNEIGKFYVFDTDNQIKHMFEQRGLASVIDQYRNCRERKEGFICDVLDGTEYKKIKILLPGLYDLILQWSTDGVSISGSSKQELWPVLATICEVSPRLRPSFMIVCGVFVSDVKPDMNVFLKPFVESLQKIHNNGGVTWINPISKETMFSMVVAPMLIADAPAKAMVVRHKYHNSRYGCNVCEQKAKKVPLTADEIAANEAQTNPRKRIRRKRRFLYQEDTGAAPLRVKDRMDQQAALAEMRGRRVF